MILFIKVLLIKSVISIFSPSVTASPCHLPHQMEVKIYGTMWASCPTPSFDEF